MQRYIKNGKMIGLMWLLVLSEVIHTYLVTTYSALPRQPLYVQSWIMSLMPDMSEYPEGTWYGWKAPELLRAGLLFLGKGISIMILGIVFLFYPSIEGVIVGVIFFAFGFVELLLGQWFFRQSKSMDSDR